MRRVQETIDRSLVGSTVIIGLVAWGVFLIDRVVKYWFVMHPAFRRDVFVGWLEFSLTYNSGIAFGLPMPHVLLLLIVSCLLLGLVGWLLTSWRQRRWNEVWSLALIVVGAASNAIDRLRFGAVVDYINVPWFTVFNLADTAITIGVLLLLLTWRRPPALDTPAATC